MQLQQHTSELEQQHEEDQQHMQQLQQQAMSLQSDLAAARASLEQRHNLLRQQQQQQTGSTVSTGRQALQEQPQNTDAVGVKKTMPSQGGSQRTERAGPEAEGGSGPGPGQDENGPPQSLLADNPALLQWEEKKKMQKCLETLRAKLKVTTLTKSEMQYTRGEVHRTVACCLKAEGISRHAKEDLKKVLGDGGRRGGGRRGYT